MCVAPVQAAIAYNNHHPHNNIQVDVINIYIDEARGWPGLGSWAPLFPVVLKYIQQQQQQQPASPYIIILMIHPSPFTITPAWPTMSENQTTPPPPRSISCCAISIRFQSTLIYTRFAPDKIHNTHPEWSTRITPALTLFFQFSASVQFIPRSILYKKPTVWFKKYYY